ncbi:hypothetical protein LguiA_005350 [Lonicera macranthoides]
MALCITRPFTNLAPKIPFFTQNHTHLQWRKTYVPFNHTAISRTNKGLRYYPNSYLKTLNSTTSEETSTVASEVKEEPDGVVSVVDVQSVEKNDYKETESDKEDSVVDGQTNPFEFLDNLNLKLDFEKDSYLILLYGGGSLFALWLVAAVVGAIDSVPLFPKLMEIVGLSYTLWFTTRYLLFKNNRDELFAKIEEIKEEIIGSGDD